MKIINFDIELLNTKPYRQFEWEEVYTNDLNSAQINFNILDMTAEELTGSVAQVLLYMSDGSFFQVTNEKITLVGTTFTYILEEHPGNHSGLALVQIIVTPTTLKEYASPKLGFKITSGLEQEVASEVMIHDWTTLTREARDYIDLFVSDEEKRQETFEISEEDRANQFNTVKSEYANIVESSELAEEARQIAFAKMVDDGIYATNIEQKLLSLETEYAPRLLEVESQMEDTKTQFNQAVGALTEDSEVILARDEYDTLKERLDSDFDSVDKSKADKLKVASIEKEIREYQATLASMNPNQEVKQSVTGYGVVSLPKNCANGQVSMVSVKGMTATNLIKNGDFSNGKTGWKETWTTSSVLDGELIFQISSAQSRLSQATINVNKDDIIYWKVPLKGTGSFDMRTRINIGDEYANISGSTLTLSNNQYVDVSKSSKALASGILFFSVYATEIIDTGSIYMKKPFIINLTTIFGVGKEPTKEQCDKMFANWFDGTKSTISAGRLKSVGKNLFDGEKKFIEHGFIRNSEGYHITNNTTVYGKVIWENKNLHHLGQMVVEIKAKSTGSLVGSFPTILYTDGTVSDGIYIHNIGFNIKRIVTTLGKIVSKITWLYGSGDSPTTVEYLYISKDVNSNYSPYTESTQYLPNVGELRSLPNGTKDEVRLSEGKLVKRVSDGVAIPTSGWVYQGKTNDGNLQIIYKATALLNYKGHSIGAIEPAKTFTVSDKTFNAYEVGSLGYIQTLSVKAICQRYPLDRLYLAIPTAEYGQTEDIAGANAYVSNNLAGTTLTYQLAEPIITPIQTSGALLSYPSGTIYAEKAVADAGVYNSGILVLEDTLPIAELETLSKVDFNTGLETKLDVSKALIAGDRVSFTHPDLVDVDIVFFTYFYDVESTQGELEVEYYDSRHTLKDSVTGKFYKVVPTVANGVLSNTLVEV